MENRLKCGLMIADRLGKVVLSMYLGLRQGSWAWWDGGEPLSGSNGFLIPRNRQQRLTAVSAVPNVPLLRSPQTKPVPVVRRAHHERIYSQLLRSVQAV